MTWEVPSHQCPIQRPGLKYPKEFHHPIWYVPIESDGTGLPPPHDVGTVASPLYAVETMPEFTERHPGVVIVVGNQAKLNSCKREQQRMCLTTDRGDDDVAHGMRRLHGDQSAPVSNLAAPIAPRHT